MNTKELKAWIEEQITLLDEMREAEKRIDFKMQIGSARKAYDDVLQRLDTRAPVACNCQSSTNESQISSCAPVAGLTEEDVERVCTGYANSGLQMDCQYGDGYRTAAIAIQNDLLAALSKKADEGH